MDDALSRMSPVDKRIVLQFATDQMNMSACSRNLNYSYSTIRYHMSSVRAKTGYDPANFFDLAKLVNAILEERREYDEERRS